MGIATFCERFMRERLYDAACLLLSEETTGLQGAYREPSDESSFRRFLASLKARAIAHAELRS